MGGYAGSCPSFLRVLPIAGMGGYAGSCPSFLRVLPITGMQSIRQRNGSPYNAVQIYLYRKYNFRSLFWAPAIFITYSLTYIFCSVIWIYMKSTTQLVWYLRSPPVQYGRRRRIGSAVVSIVFNGISIDPTHITSDKKIFWQAGEFVSRQVDK